MSIVILYVDIRQQPLVLNKYTTTWQQGMSAADALYSAVEDSIAHQISYDLSINSGEIMVSWSSLISSEHSDVGGVDDLDWEIPDDSVLSIVYEDQQHTSQAALNESIEWMIAAIED